MRTKTVPSKAGPSAEAMERDIQNFAPQTYAQTVPGILGDQHGVLLASIEAFLSSRPSPGLLVLGCGGEVLPYSFQYRDGALSGSNVDRVHAMLRNGKLILLDVSDNAESGLRRSRHVLTCCGFFKPNRFCAYCAGGKTFAPKSQVHSASYGPSSVIFLQQNLRDPLFIADESVDAIDANLSLHHVTQTQESMLRMYRELWRVLKPGGLLHLGEGNVDMNYSERKICRLATDLAGILAREVVVQDDRDPKHPLHFIVAPGSQDSVLRHSPAPKTADISISADAIVHLRPGKPAAASAPGPTAGTLITELSRRGYRQSLVMADHVALPLIDPLMESDREELIDGVAAYYEAVLERCRRAYAGKRDELVRATETAVAIERGYAASGIVEYYMGEKLILDALGKSGFEDLRVIRHSEPFYNILANKPCCSPTASRGQ